MFSRLILLLVLFLFNFDLIWFALKKKKKCKHKFDTNATLDRTYRDIFQLYHVYGGVISGIDRADPQLSSSQCWYSRHVTLGITFDLYLFRWLRTFLEPSEPPQKINCQPDGVVQFPFLFLSVFVSSLLSWHLAPTQTHAPKSITFLFLSALWRLKTSLFVTHLPISLSPCFHLFFLRFWFDLVRVLFPIHFVPKSAARGAGGKATSSLTLQRQ